MTDFSNSPLELYDGSVEIKFTENKRLTFEFREKMGEPCVCGLVLNASYQPLNI